MTNATEISLHHFNYAAAFDDQSVKVGVTSAPFYRLQDYLQEARRHGKRVTAFTITKPAKDKAAALRVEAAVCKLFETSAIDGHREWFRENLSWASARFRARRRREAPDFFQWHVFQILRDEWGKEHTVHYLIERGKARREGRQFVHDKYERVVELAEEVGKLERISAAKATAMAAAMVAA